MGIGSLTSTAAINKLGSKVCLFIGGLGNVQWILISLLAPYQKSLAIDKDIKTKPNMLIVLALFGSTMVNGFTVGILWATANNFVASCASEKTKGFCFSYFWIFYMTSQIIGNLLAAYTLGSFNQVSFFIVMAFIAFSGTLSFLLLRQPTINAKVSITESRDSSS